MGYSIFGYWYKSNVRTQSTERELQLILKMNSDECVLPPRIVKVFNQAPDVLDELKNLCYKIAILGAPYNLNSSFTKNVTIGAEFNETGNLTKVLKLVSSHPRYSMSLSLQD